MTLEIMVIAKDRHNNVAGLNRVMGFHCLYTYIYWVMIFDSTQYEMIVNHNQAYNLSAGFLQGQIKFNINLVISSYSSNCQH